jgi:hypothetical protein
MKRKAAAGRPAILEGTPGETVVLLEHDEYGEPLKEPSLPPPPNYHDVDVGRSFALLSPEQRMIVLRAGERAARGRSESALRLEA